MVVTQKPLMILRVPQDMAETVTNLVRAGEKPPEEGPEDAAASTGENGNAEGHSQPHAHKQMLEVKLDKDASTEGYSTERFLVTMNDKVYPALLMNIPTPVEVHKQFGGGSVLKSGDVGQVLQIFHTEEELLEVRATIKDPPQAAGMNPEDRYMAASMVSGLTKPTNNIVKKHYEKVNGTEAPDFATVAELTEEIHQAIIRAAGKGSKKKFDEGVATFHVSADDMEPSELAVLTTENEEIVDYEDWMATDDYPDGVSVTISNRPNWTTAEDGDKSNLIVQVHPEGVLGEESQFWHREGAAKEEKPLPAASS